MRQAKKEREKFQSQITFILDPCKKIPKRLAKKLTKLKNLLPALFLAKMGRDMPRKREKNFSPEFRSYSTRARKFRKEQRKISKNEKTSFRQHFQPKWDMICRESEKKISVPNSVHTRHGKENSEKNSKEIQKIKKPLSGIIFCQNEMRQAEKEKKKITLKFCSYSTRARKFQKKQQKNSKKLKNLFPALFIAKTG